MLLSVPVNVNKGKRMLVLLHANVNRCKLRSLLANSQQRIFTSLLPLSSLHNFSEFLSLLYLSFEGTLIQEYEELLLKLIQLQSYMKAKILSCYLLSLIHSLISIWV